MRPMSDQDLNIEVELTNDYGTFDAVVNEIDTKKDQCRVTLLEDTSFAEKGDSSWVPISQVEKKVKKCANPWCDRDADWMEEGELGVPFPVCHKHVDPRNEVTDIE